MIQNRGWIPISIERFPNSNKPILLSFYNFQIPLIGRFEKDNEGGAFYLIDDDKTCLSKGMCVNAWMPLAEPYKEE